MSAADPLRQHILALLDGGQAHIDFQTAVKGFPPALRGRKPDGAPHTAWQLLEHLRIAQEDILRFIQDPHYVSPKWPEGYWPQGDTPPTAGAWDESVRAFNRDSEAMRKLVADPKTDLLAALPHGDGQTVLREALLVADHNAYHLGQLMYLRKTIGA